jgi:hypothetical protein
MKLGMLSVARTELFNGIKYYNKQREGLGFEFAAEAKNTLLRIVNYPEAWSKFSAGSRRCLMKRFPYAVLYRYSDGHILILAFMHMSRDPDHWRDLSKSK